MTLEELREQIDALDRRLVELISERAKAALMIGHLKASTNLPVYEPAREKIIYANVRAANEGASVTDSDILMETLAEMAELKAQLAAANARADAAEREVTALKGFDIVAENIDTSVGQWLTIQVHADNQQIDLTSLEALFLDDIQKSPLPDNLTKHLRPESRAAFNILQHHELIRLSKSLEWRTTQAGDDRLRYASASAESEA